MSRGSCDADAPESAGTAGGKERTTDHFSDETLSAFLDGDLDARDSTGIESHLRECTSCREALQELTAIRRAAAGLATIEPAPETWVRIRERVAAPPRRLLGWTWAGAAAAAAVLLVVAVLGRAFVGAGHGPRAPEARLREAAVTAGTISPTREAADAGLDEQYREYLAGVEAAISEIERALAENPSNPRVRRAYAGAQDARNRSFDLLVAGGR